MSPENSSTPTKLCPTCGTRLSETATRCLVCGSEITATATPKSSKAVQGTRMPEITLSLPAALGLLALFLTIGAVLIFFVLQGTGRVVEPTPSVTPSITPTITLTPTATATGTPEPTSTPLVPTEYTVASGDTCGSIAIAFDVTSLSIITLNNLPASCNNLVVGQKLQIPQPTPTPSPQPSATLSSAQATEAACQKIDYTVAAGDTLSSIAANYNVTQESVREYNGMSNDVVFEGMNLIIPLCQRKPTAGPTPTATPPPPYPAPNLLLPADGAAFNLSNDTITLQWASVATLRENEAYAVTIIDVTEGTERKLVDYVTDTKFIVSNTFRPQDTVPHVMRWSVLTVRQIGSDEAGKPVWEPAGAVSAQRVFTWTGGGSTPAETPTPTP